MRFVPCNQETKNRMIELIQSYTHVYGVDIVECGSQEFHIEFIRNYGDNHPNVLIGEFIDDDGEVISIATFYFAETVPACIARTGFHTKIGLQRYTIPQLFKEQIKCLWKDLVERGVTEFYWVQRAARARQWNDIWDKDPEVIELMKGWMHRDYERIEPFNTAKNELLGVYLLGSMNGIIPKPVIIKQLFKISAYTKK